MIYAFELFEKQGGYGVELEMSKGHEAHFHAAAVDVALEHFRIRWGLGPLVVATASVFFRSLAKIGVKNLSIAYSEAMDAGAGILDLIAKYS